MFYSSNKFLDNIEVRCEYTLSSTTELNINNKEYKMKRWLLMPMLLTLLVFSCKTTEETVHEKKNGNGYLTHEVKAYIPTWASWSADDVDGSQLTELILSFALVSFVEDENGEYKNPYGDGKVTYTGELSDRDVTPQIYEELNILRERYPELKITVALGGWGADGFSDAVLTEESREKFTTSIVDYLLEHNFDGLDIDWEFPVIGGWGAIKARPQDRKNFTLFMQLLREKMIKAGESVNKDLELSVAANQGNAYFNEWVNLRAVVKVVDHINLMTYDNVGMWAGRAQHHSNAAFVEDAVKRFIAAGVPPHKLVLGGAFYGKLITDVDGLNKNFGENTSVTDISWDVIAENYLDKNGFVRHWDSKGRSAYLWNEEKRELITYDDPQSLTEKAEIVKKYNLAGAMFWDYSHDTSYTLVTALSDNFKK